MGVYALLTNTTGAHNTASGTYSLYSNTTGNTNTATGGLTLKITQQVLIIQLVVTRLYIIIQPAPLILQ